MSLKNQKMAFMIFSLFSITTLLWVSYTQWIPIQLEDYNMILVYLFLMVLINSLPLKIGGIFISFTFAVSIAVFLDYGLVVEVWLTQVAFLVTMLISSEKRSIPRILLSNMMFIWISILSGFSFFLFGGEVQFSVSELWVQITPIFIYSASYFLANHFILYLIRRFISPNRVPMFTEDMIWDAATLLLTLPLGVLMYMVKVTYGQNGMIFVAFPILIVSHLFKIYSELRHSHQQLQALNKISASFTSELNLDKAVSSLQMAIRELFSFDYSYIFLTNGIKLNPISIEHSDGTRIEESRYQDFSIKVGEGLTGRVANNREGEIVGSHAEFFTLEVEPDYIQNNRSLLSVPMVWNQQTIGVITLGSAREYHFSKKDLTIAKILASQAAVAIQNARKYKKTEEKSKLDELTGLYNYRAFDQLLQDKSQESKMKEEKLSLLIIDLDHFKQVNDRFGHLAGNEVLKIIANLLKEYTRKEDIIARYGGEEFTVIAPNTDHEEAKVIAERIRYAIQHHPIKLTNSIDRQAEIIIQVTASIGIASYPDMASSVNDLIRHADRAMYFGSKQAGRNRVSVYETG
ncbi:MAG: diguanylate cyclase [Tepidibacillus sp.]